MTNKELYKYMDDLLKMHLTEQSKQSCLYICNKLTEWFAKNAVTVNVNNWVNDYSTGYDTAKEDIMKFAQEHMSKHKSANYDQWKYGYVAGMLDIIEHIERM